MPKAVPSRPLWANDHPVLEELRRRRAEGSQPGRRGPSDVNVRIGLAIEGGGMRGIISAAMVCAIEDLGILPAIDVVYGCSSGAINAAYFLAGETWHPLSIYYDELVSKQFFDLRRMFTGKPALDLNYVFGEVLEKRKPLDYERVISSDIPLCVAVTDVNDQKTVVAQDFADKEDLKSALIATSWLPVAVPGTTTFRGRRVIDGGVLTAHPFRLAVQDGCTHILSLSTRQIRPPRKGYSILDRYAARNMERIKPGLGHGYLRGLDEYREDRRMLQHRMLNPSPDPYILDLAPIPSTPEVKRHEFDRGRLIEGARSAYEIMYCAIENKPFSMLAERRVRAIPRFRIVEDGVVPRDSMPAEAFYRG